MATSGRNIDVKMGWIAFEVERCYTMFCSMDEKVIFPNSSVSDAFPLSPEIDMEDVLNCQDPSDFDRISTKDPDQGVKVEFASPTSPSVPKVEADASNESPMSCYCRFTQVIFSLPPMEGVDLDFDMGIEHDHSGQYEESRNHFVL